MDKLPNCKLCGSASETYQPTRGVDSYLQRCSNSECHLHQVGMGISEWRTLHSRDGEAWDKAMDIVERVSGDYGDPDAIAACEKIADELEKAKRIADKEQAE